MTPKAKPTGYTELSQELQEVLLKLENGELDIDQAVALYERGLTIVQLLETQLKDAEHKVTELKAAHEQSTSS